MFRLHEAINHARHKVIKLHYDEMIGQ